MTGFKIRYQNEFLDLVPEQSLEIERVNPMFNIETVIAEYSTPVSVKATDKNIRLLGNIFFDLDAKGKLKYAVEFWDHESFVYNATLVLDKSVTNRRFYEKSIASGFLLIGYSKLFNALKDRKANSLNYDKEDRIFPLTTTNPTDGSGGYWQHFHNTWDNTYDYVVAPIHNDDWYGDDAMNTLYYNGFMNQLVNGYLETFQPVVIQPRVSYIMRKLIEENGWQFDDSAMAGTGWDRLFLFNPVPIQYYVFAFSPLMFTQLQIQLATYISPELSCSDLFFELCKHYGWIPHCDTDAEVIKLVPLKQGSAGIERDYTKYAADEVSNDFSGVVKTFSFKNTFPSNDSAIDNVDLSSYSKGTPVFAVADLPFPSGNYDTVIIFVYVENKYYKIDLNTTTNLREWVVASDNIYDSEIPDNVETVESKVTTLPMYRTQYRVNDTLKYYMFVPYCKQSQFKDWGIRTLLYLGMAYEEKEDGTAGTYQYPQLSSIRCLHDGTEVAAFSNVFNHTNPNTGVDLGIIPYWFRSWTDLVSSAEINEEKILLPIHKLRDLRWNDTILLFNIPYLIKSYIEPRPYNDFIVAKLQRLVAPAASTGVVGGKVYVKLYQENVITGQSAVNPYLIPGTTYQNELSGLTTAELVVKFYSDAAGTKQIFVPKITIKWKYVHTWNTIVNPAVYLDKTYSNLKQGKYADFIGNTKIELAYSSVWNPSSPYIGAMPFDGNHLNIYTIEPSADYEIIP
jgi:hypothetical protein